MGISVEVSEVMVQQSWLVRLGQSLAIVFLHQREVALGLAKILWLSLVTDRDSEQNI